MKKQVLITVVVAIFAFIIGYRADKTYDLKRESVKIDSTSSSSSEADTSSSKQEPIKPSPSSHSSSSSKVELSPELEQRFGATFRNTKWGDSKETVRKYEKEELQDEGDFLAGITSVYGMKYGLVYFFKDNELYQSGYMLDEGRLTGGQYIDRYSDIKEKLIQNYGEPIEDKVVDYDDLYRGNPGKSLEMGHTVYYAVWETSTTKIEIGMESQNFEISFVIRYTDINYVDNPKDSGL